MKVSKYSFLFDYKNDEYYIYNTLSNALIEIDNESYRQLTGAKHTHAISPDNFDKELWDVLCENNMITDNDDDDFLKYKSNIIRLRAQRDSLHLTLAPTMDCCFHCHYCFEKYKGHARMSPEVMDSIIRYIQSIQNLNHIKLTWFGGEPLMAVPQMKTFQSKLKKAWTKKFTSSIITTGYHINKRVIQCLKELNISAVQITLDGIKETHNKIKYLPKEHDVFGKVLRNVELLNDEAPEIHITLRVNLTKENAHEYIQLYDLYVHRFKGRRNIAIAPAFVLDRGASGCKISTLFRHDERSSFILKLGELGIPSTYMRYPEPFFNECAVRNAISISFDPEGYAYKCWELIGNKEYAIGKLDTSGRLTEFNEKIWNRQMYGADPIDDPICSQCEYLPICNGGCPIQRIENKFDNGNNCTCTHYKGFIEEFLRMHIGKKKVEI